MKKSILIFLCLLFGGCLTLTIKQTADAKGQIRYNLSEDGVLSFYGKGELKSIDHLINYEQKESVKMIIIGQGITGIKKEGISHYWNAKKVIFPSSLKKIGENAFCYMKSLKTIEIPDSVTTIGKGAFSDCDSLKKLVLPASLKSWKKGIAQDCPSLSTIINRSKVSCHLDDCEGWRIWRVNGKKTRVLPKKKIARAKGKKIPITYDLAGGKRTGKLPQYYEYGTKLKLPDTVKRNDYEFFGWYSEDSRLLTTLYYIDQDSFEYTNGEDERIKLKKIKLTPCWFKFELLNNKEGTVQITLDGSKNRFPIVMYEVQYSEFKDMSSAYSGFLLDVRNKKTVAEITNMQRGKVYYFEFKTREEREIERDSWMGKKKIQVK